MFSFSGAHHINALDSLASAHASDSLFDLVVTASGASFSCFTAEDGESCQQIAYEACRRLGERDSMRG